MSLEGANLLPEGLFVLWHWEWVQPSDQVSEDVSCQPDMDGTSDHETLSSGSECDDANADIPKHTIAFKCIGASRDPESQEVLALAAKRRKEGQIINVTLCPEPLNKYDAKAIAFTFEVNGEWKRVGYVVREALDSVHMALRNNEILKVEVRWIKYLLHWSRSGPGWYAAINITKTGQWPADVELHKSTM